MTPEERQPGYITLKEASEQFGYTQDYLGQLIRKGKIPGKLVYSHVAWVTTPEAVLAYKDRAKQKKEGHAVLDMPHEYVVETLHAGSDVVVEDHASVLSLWLIRFFRVLVFVTILFTLFVFYLLTTAFGEELHVATIASHAQVEIGGESKTPTP
jgi:hypothetical protein